MAPKKVRLTKPKPWEISVKSASLVMAEVASETIVVLSLSAPSLAPVTQPSSSSILVEVASRGLADLDFPLEEGSEGVTLLDWKIARDLERTLFLVELERVNAMCFPKLRKQLVTVMQQVLFCSSFFFSLHSF